MTKVTLPDGGIEKYHYDACGRLRELITGEQKTSYGYDKAGRLAEVCSSNGIRAQYQYDRNGMQTEENYLTADGTSTKRLHYAYDVYNRNVSVTGDDFTQKNHYDAEGYRDSITEKDKVTNFVYQGGMLLHELDEEKNPARHYALGNDENLRMRFGKKDKCK